MHRRLRAAPLLFSVALAAAALAGTPQVDLRLRARVLTLVPEQPARILWTYGGQGQSGDPVSGELTAVRPRPPAAPDAASDAADVVTLEPTSGALADRVIVEGSAVDLHYLRPGVWSPDVSLSTFGSGGRRFLTFTLIGHRTEEAIRDAEVEFEVLQGTNSVKRFRVAGPDGPTFGVVLPLGQRDANGAATPAFVAELGSLLDYARAREAMLRAMPGADRPVPARYAMFTDCSGYGAGAGYGIRTADKETMLTEYRSLRLMGMNGLRGGSGFFTEMICKGEGLGREFRRIREGNTIGYPIPTVEHADGRAPTRHPGDGCPYHPENRAGIAGRVAAAVEELRASARGLGVDELWALTIDEIGTVFGRAPEGSAHMGCCPYCREAFRDLIRADGLAPADFGAAGWEPVRPTPGYWTVNFWDSERLLKKAYDDACAAASRGAAASREGAGADPNLGAGGEDDLTAGLLADIAGTPAPKSATELAAGVEQARKRYDDLMWSSRVLEVPEGERKLEVSDKGWRLLSYYSRRFSNRAAAQLFEPLQRAIAAENVLKEQALARGEADSPYARQAWLYSFALRGNTFLMGGGTLDFFEFYQYADNAFVYETSNRDRRVWQWDSYLCDVGRSLTRFYGKRFGIYVKPHRGAPIQRGLTAVARGARMIYWYTFGPEWKKGDSFGSHWDLLPRIGQVARLVAAAEDVTYDSDWAVPAEVAIVRPRTAEFYSGPASWEDGKWVYTALMHGHIPVDPLDEELLLSQDLSAYKAIVVCGSHLRRAVAAKLRDWVEAGGTLYACGWGAARDEADEPLELLWPVFGVTGREPMDAWGAVPRYGATSLGRVSRQREPPAGAAVTGSAPLAGTFAPEVGREVLLPAEGTSVLARYGDGGAAVTRRRFGKGTAWLVGVYPGVEYAVDTMNGRPFDAGKRSFVTAPIREAGVRPVVDAAEPLVEGVLLRNRISGRDAVVLINWKHHVDAPLTIRIRGAGAVRSARSLALEQDFTVDREGDESRLVLPSLAEGDILLLTRDEDDGKSPP